MKNFYNHNCSYTTPINETPIYIYIYWLCRPVRARVSGVVPVWPLILRGKWRGERKKGSCTVEERRRRKQGEVCGDGDCAGWKKLPPFEARGGYNRRPEEGGREERRGEGQRRIERHREDGGVG